MPSSSDILTTVTIGTGKYSPTKEEISQIDELGSFGKADYIKLGSAFPNSPVMGTAPDAIFGEANSLFEFYMGIVFNRGSTSEAQMGQALFGPTSAGSDFVGNSKIASNLEDFGEIGTGAPDMLGGGFHGSDRPSDHATNPPPASKFYPNLSSPSTELPAKLVQGTATAVYTEGTRGNKTWGSGKGTINSPQTTSTTISNRISVD